MTRKQYEEFNNEDFLTTEEKAQQNKLNSQNHYGLSDSQLLNLIRKHRTARKREDYKTMAIIEYRLTEINFHYESSKLKRGEYNEILNKIHI